MIEDREIEWLECHEPHGSLALITHNPTEWISYYHSSDSNQIFRKINEPEGTTVWEVGIESRL